ncbi:MAG: Sir2 silent information regulator family NAD-dependent deacetylase [Clostridia bacterium]|nr:Sir2 silent information regulator family NAD-dependent deacetylase [Clostridia bacterium]
MFSRLTTHFTENYTKQIHRIKNEISNADAIIIGAGAGLSASAGFTYSGERFEKYFSDFVAKYGITDMYSGGFYPFPSLEEFWAWWSRHILVNRYEKAPKPIYEELHRLIKDKNYFVLTTNVDHQFQKAGFDKQRLFYTQGDYGLFQCSKPCHDKTYDNEDMVLKMVSEQKDMKIPSALVPRCPVCGEPMTMNLRSDDTFVEDKGWHKAAKRYNEFLENNCNKRILLLELGVGANTPVIIKYPFWKMTAKNPDATYVCINFGESCCPSEIEKQAVCINSDIGKVIDDLLKV